MAIKAFSIGCSLFPFLSLHETSEVAAHRVQRPLRTSEMCNRATANEVANTHTGQDGAGARGAVTVEVDRQPRKLEKQFTKLWGRGSGEGDAGSSGSFGGVAQKAQNTVSPLDGLARFSPCRKN